MSKTKIALLTILCFIGLFALVWGLSYHELIYTKFFSPRKQNIEREVFENTKSYVHGKIQELAGYYEEYQKAESDGDKEAVANIIKMNFANFDANKIQNYGLKQFLISTRGF